MTLAEFNQWLADYCATFPETADWINRFGVKVTGRWKAAFDEKRVTLNEALLVTKAMISGEVEAVKAFERELTPAIIIRAVKEKRLRTTAPSFEEEMRRQAEFRHARQVCNFPAGKLFRAITERIASGVPKEIASREVLEDFENGKFEIAVIEN